MSDARPLAAAAWMAASIVSFAGMTVSGRELSRAYDTFEIMTYRSLVGVVVIVVCATAFRRLHRIHFRRMRLHLLRNVCHFTGQNLWFFAIAVAPLAQVIAVEFTAPLWVALLAPLVLGERLTPLRMGAACLGFVGALIVAQPRLDHIPPGLTAVAGAAVFFALSALFTKRLTRTEPVLSILFWLTLMQLVFGVVCAGLDGGIAAPRADMAHWLILVGICGLGAHFCLTQALTLAPATIVMPFDFARLPAIALVGVIVYGEPLGISLVVGAAIIIVANWINMTAGAAPRPRGVSGG